MQKTTVAIIVLVFVASLSIGINIGLTWNNQTPNILPTILPHSSSPPSSGALNVSYTESGREEKAIILK